MVVVFEIYASTAKMHTAFNHPNGMNMYGP
jgi:hypothetical protein